ncbi:hypothetical protein AAFP35_04450 [Gordonia sp. CPCC 206044]|uniref:hypothetical protein n=1 Tax=Gordonia sp. CPCC 206044 TaxID=3140793 RepID=UPI003AF3AF13
MGSDIHYLFGIGDGHTTPWISAADTDLDGDRHPDAVGLDFDGDGRRDDAMWDTDADGRADVAALDRDDDGEPEIFYRDDGTGVWGERVERPVGLGSPSEGSPDGYAQPGAPEVPPPAGRLTDPTHRESEPTVGDEDAETTVVRSTDLDGDGRTDVEVVGTRRAGVAVAERLFIDEDGDSEFDRVLVDENGDGRADVSFDDRSPRFDRR